MRTRPISLRFRRRTGVSGAAAALSCALVALSAPCSAGGLDLFGPPAILKAVSSGDVAWAQSLLLSGEDVNKRDENGLTPLMLAARANNLGMVELLLQHRASVRLKDKLGNSALFWAAGGDAGVIEALVRAGAHVNDRNDQGLTPLMAAARADNAEATRALLAAGADRKAQDSAGHDAADWARDSRARHTLALLSDAPPAAARMDARVTVGRR